MAQCFGKREPATACADVGDAVDVRDAFPVAVSKT
jgi:hypothetical protein